MGPGRLEGRAALVTGATGRLGRAATAALLAEGAAVVAADTTALELEGWARAEARAGSRLLAVVADPSEPEGASRSVDRARLAAGGPLVVAACAPEAAERSLGRLEIAAWTVTVEGFVRSCFLLCQAVSRAEADEERGGAVLLLAPGPALHGAGFGQAHLSVRAGAMAGLVHSASAELRRRAISVNGVLVSREADGAEAGAPDRGADGDRTAAAVLSFLASPEAGRITGQVVHVEGPRVALRQTGRTAGAISERGRWSIEEISSRWAEISR